LSRADEDVLACLLNKFSLDKKLVWQLLPLAHLQFPRGVSVASGVFVANPSYAWNI
jgi:hypothetical protein